MRDEGLGFLREGGFLLAMGRRLSRVGGMKLGVKWK